MSSKSFLSKFQGLFRISRSEQLQYPLFVRCPTDSFPNYTHYEFTSRSREFFSSFVCLLLQASHRFVDQPRVFMSGCPKCTRIFSNLCRWKTFPPFQASSYSLILKFIFIIFRLFLPM